MNPEISTDQSLLDVPMIHRFLAEESYWIRGISYAAVEKSIRHSLCFGLQLDKAQVGFARAVTDYVRFAHVLDVFVLTAFRGRGFGKLLVNSLLTHPDLASVRRFSLGTADAHELYAQFGFAAPAQPERLMELMRPSI